MRLLRSTAIIGFFTLASRILGMVRDILLARLLGAGPIADALFTAFRLPNLFRRIFAEGAFNAAFVPLYARRLEEQGQDAASQFAREALSILLVGVAILVALFEATMPIAMNILGAGLSREAIEVGAPGQMNSFAISPYDIAVRYAWITMPYLLFMSVAALFSGILNTKNYFAIAAAAPIALNAALICVLIWGEIAGWPRFWLGIYLCAAMSLSGIVQVAMVVWGCRRAGIAVGLRRPRLTPDVRRLISLGLPGALAAGITQINLMVSHNIATTQTGAPSWLNYADRLYQLPLGMIGIAMGIALLPALTRSLRSGDEAGANTTLNRATEFSMALTVPAAVALFVISEIIVAGLFETGAFSRADTLQTAIALRMFALGLPAFVLIKILTPAFFSRENTKTPMIYAGISAVINAALGAALFFTLGFFGLALATSVAAWVNTGLLLRSLIGSGDLRFDARLARRMPRIILAAGIMGGALAFASHFIWPLVGGSIWVNFGWLLLVSLSGLAVYALSAIALGAVRPADFKNALSRRSAAPR